MGQYHLVVNLDKQEFLHPHQLGDGLKLWEQVGIGGVATALHALLAVSNGRGGGDFDDDKFVGRWGGDRIAIIGDYAESGDLPPDSYAEAIYGACAYADETDGDEHFLAEGEARELLPFKPSDWTNISALAREFMSRQFGFTYSGGGWMQRGTDEGSPFRDDYVSGLSSPDMVVTGGTIVRNPIIKRPDEQLDLGRKGDES